MISPSKWIAGALLAISCAITPLAIPQDLGDSRKEDDAFLLLRDSVRRNDATKAEFYAARLSDYAIPSYVDYYRLKSHFTAATSAEILAFLQRYEGTAIADRLRNDWLLELGRKREWALFDQQYPLFVLKDDTQVKCYALLSRLSKGENVATDARTLLIYPPYYGEGCSALIASLAQTGQFSQEDLWAQVRLAGETKATGPARRTIMLLNGSDKKIAQAIDVPAVVLAKGVGDTKADREVFLVALGRAARTSVKLSVLALEKALPRLTPQEQAIGWANIALPASYAVDPETSGYWRRANGAPLSIDQHQWRTRYALRDGNWQLVRDYLAAMPAQLRQDPTWVYWQARTFVALAGGRMTPEAQFLYQSIADREDYYGLLAAEELGRTVTIPAPGAPVTAQEIAAIATNPGIRRALKFFDMRLRFEGLREWNWEVRHLSDRELIAAAEYARQHHILDRMVYTSERTRALADYTHRYPAPHDEIMRPTTNTLGLDRAWVYGLIRQESRFVMNAQSSAGASGLMQVMPSTGRWVANKIGLTNFVQDMLTDVRTNILLGANYMNMVLGSMDGSQVLATAAYNAGPGRLRSWRSKLDKPMDATVFIESIPYSETRGYVKNVMTNATYYAALFEGRPQSMKARLGVVTPKGYSEKDMREPDPRGQEPQQTSFSSR
ncbi:lytic transglycosylase domain-containing protein [Pseudoduganella albidiflava]|uniref:Transglycosylase n=1 Tax=Pseudoduganella albidiflava TaxID=321983 RepID=A0A411X5D6_9BURK|nr:lytic transglycosylase domain-containing protein [Pseudoduganella albidiflava]QBI04088.1 lytic transglycosylase domain-containing protein [Pseudoduganella albidiflava]GGY24599.1 transglycosylase [Pseudoduganella albidiflava]